MLPTHRNKSQAFAFERFPQVLLQMGHFRHARSAPGGEKAKHHHPVAEVHRLSLDGQTVDFSNRVVVLSFFATWCGPCMAEMPHLQKDLWEPLKSKGLTLIAVGREHSVAEMNAFQAKKGFSFLFAADPKREVFGKFATQSIPRCVVVGRDGHIKFQSIGFEEKEFANLV